MILILIAALLAEGPIAKFERRAPEAEYDTPRRAGDVERCLIDLSGMSPPLVFRQPDRPNAATLIWQAHGPLSAPAVNRVDLVEGENGTHVKGWFSKEDLLSCAPR